MNRRRFLAGVGAAAAIAVVPVRALAKLVKPAPREWGNAVRWFGIGWGELSEPQREHLLYLLHRNAAEKLPIGTRYEIRMKIPGYYGREHGVAWYRHEAMDAAPAWITEPFAYTNGCYQPEGGYYLLGRYIMPPYLVQPWCEVWTGHTTARKLLSS